MQGKRKRPERTEEEYEDHLEAMERERSGKSKYQRIEKEDEKMPEEAVEEEVEAEMEAEMEEVPEVKVEEPVVPVKRKAFVPSSVR